MRKKPREEPDYTIYTAYNTQRASLVCPSDSLFLW